MNHKEEIRDYLGVRSVMFIDEPFVNVKGKNIDIKTFHFTEEYPPIKDKYRNDVLYIYRIGSFDKHEETNEFLSLKVKGLFLDASVHELTLKEKLKKFIHERMRLEYQSDFSDGPYERGRQFGLQEGYNEALDDIRKMIENEPD